MSSSPNMGAASHWSECCQLLTLATVSLVSCAVSCPEWELEALGSVAVHTVSTGALDRIGRG